jgi:RluA family pseudouridine synthase
MSALEVLYCDNHLLVVHKPPCVPVVPDSSGDESLLERAKAWIQVEFHKPGAVFLGVVHRLDRPVSGVLLFARTSKAAERLSAQFRERRVRKAYWGVVQGRPAAPAGTLEQHLWKDGERNRVHVVAASREGAKVARTSYRVLRGADGRSLLELVPHTGRAHQLRLACASLGTPLLGDLKYGALEALPDRSIALHARRLEVEHPTLREARAWEVEPPRSAAWA